jgi:metal transporter CNNM
VVLIFVILTFRFLLLCRVPADTPMYDMFKLFQTGRSHMVLLTQPPPAAAAAGLHSAADAGDSGGSKSGSAGPLSPRPAVLGSGDASGVPLGIITIEDVIEELMQTEIGAVMRLPCMML